MKVYAVYGFSFGETFLLGVYVSLDSAISAIYKDFYEYIAESLEIEDITKKQFDTAFDNINIWKNGGYKTTFGFRYITPALDYNDPDNLLYYYFEETEIQP